jgi:hypothetical protein
MRRTKTLASLVAALVFALTVGGYAYAHPLGYSQGIDGFESDISEDNVINVCNPRGIRAERVVTAIANWNAITHQDGWLNPHTGELGNPALRMATHPNCEVTVVEQGGARANFYARVLFAEAHPDRLEISPRFKELSVEQREASLTHELGHVLGLDHPEADVDSCANSIMTTIEECRAVGVPRISTPGDHDERDLRDYWVDDPIYPVPNKCWDNTDADDNGVCDRFGPPSDSRLRASSREGGGGAGRNGGTSGPSSAVQVPAKVIED